MDKDIKDIMKRLGSAINDTLQDSEKIQKLLQELESKGFTLTLSLAVMVGINNFNNPRRRPRQPAAAGEGEGNPTTAFDRKFLKALRIKLTEER